MKSRQRMKVTTRSYGKLNKSCHDRRELPETKTKRTSKKIMLRHEKKILLVATEK